MTLCSPPQVCHIEVLKASLNQRNEFPLTREHNATQHDLTSQQIDNVQYTESNQTHRDKSLSYTHMHSTHYPPSPHTSSYDQGPVHPADMKLSSYYGTEIVS